MRETLLRAPRLEGIFSYGIGRKEENLKTGAEGGILCLSKTHPVFGACENRTVAKVILTGVASFS
jgi:hypothetical protein